MQLSSLVNFNKNTLKLHSGLGGVKGPTVNCDTAKLFVTSCLVGADILSKGHITRCLLLFKSFFI